MRRHILRVGLGLFVLCCVLASGQKAEAIGLNYFDDTGVGVDCDVSNCNNTVIVGQVGQSSKNMTFGSNNMIAYFSANSGTLVVDNPHFCAGAAGFGDSLNSPDWYSANPMADGTRVAQFITYGATTITQYGVKYASADARCSNTLVFNLTNLPFDGDVGMYYVRVSASHLDNRAGTCNATVKTGCDGVINNYKVRVQGATAQAISHSNGNRGTEITVRQLSGLLNNVDYTIRFGADCSVGVSGTDRPLVYYGMANLGNSGEQLNGQITMELWDDTNLALIDSWTPDHMDYGIAEHMIRFMPGIKYRWVIKNVYRGNTLQFGTPYDGIYYNKPCEAAVPTSPVPPPAPPPPPRPYFQTQGGDVVAGASMATPNAAGVITPCSVAPHISSAGIVSWNYDGAPNYAGAGGQYAAFALGQVQDFVTGQGNAAAPADGAETNQLTFANSNYSGSVDVSKGLFGGMFDSAPCVELWADKPATASALPGSTIDVNTLVSDTYFHTGDISLLPTKIAPGKRITIYVNGNVDIGGPTPGAGSKLEYDTIGWTGRDKIPSFRLIVHGSIFVNHQIAALDGLYAAIPDTGYADPSTPAGSASTWNAPKAGTFATCSAGFASVDPGVPVAGRALSDCNRQLVVTGSVVAQQVWMLRTYGNLGVGPAEIFRYSPEVWLSPIGGATVSSDEYQSIIGLPPTL